MMRLLEQSGEVREIEVEAHARGGDGIPHQSFVVRLRAKDGDFECLGVEVRPGPSGVLTGDDLAGVQWRRMLNTAKRLERERIALSAGAARPRRTKAEKHPAVLEEIAALVTTRSVGGRPAFVTGVVEILRRHNLPCDERTAKRWISRAREVGVLTVPPLSTGRAAREDAD